MTVYVESNFVLEIALGQEQANAAEAILGRAERGEIMLALPSFSLSEPFAAIRRRSNESQRLGSELRTHMKERGRSAPHQEDVRELMKIPSLLESIERREIEMLTATIGRLLSIAIAIPISFATYTEALAIMDRIGLKPQDAMVYSPVLHHLRTANFPGPHLFANRNWLDFEVPQILNELEVLNCEFVRSFDVAALRLEQIDRARG